MAAEYAEHDGQFLFVYTREAHPSDRYPGHTSFEQKKSVASEMAKQLGFARPMLVDDLEGTVHHAYGRLPNMTYIVNPGGTIIYRAAWTDPRTIRLALEQRPVEEFIAAMDEVHGTTVLFERGARRAKRRLTPYHMKGTALRMGGWPSDRMTT